MPLAIARPRARPAATTPCEVVKGALICAGGDAVLIVELRADGQRIVALQVLSQEKMFGRHSVRTPTQKCYLQI